MRYRKTVRSAAVLLAALFSLLFGGCINGCESNIEGYSDVVKAKRLYSQLNSGHFLMQDNSTGETTQEFTFMYNYSSGNLHYLYMAADKDDVYYEFHNGSEMNYRHKADDGWTGATFGSAEFYVYTRNNKHPYTDEGVIAVNAHAVTGSTAEETEDGKKITFYYDASKLADALSELGTLTSFESTVWLNEQGYCFRLDQKGVFENNGESVSDFSLFIDQMNEVKDIARPEM